MWESIELREIRVFLALAQELHFTRTAQRLGLTQARVSQSLRQLERKLGRQLVRRTSRTVALTADGQRFLGRVTEAYGQLAVVLRESADNAAEPHRLVLGVFEPCAAGPHLLAIVEEFERRHPDCEAIVRDIPHADDPLARLRDGDVDLLAIRQPLDEADLVVGPVLTRDERVVAVAASHPLATRDTVSIEDVAAYPVTDCAGVPRSVMEAFVPPVTPAGRPLNRIDASPVRPYEVAALVALGKVVHPTVPSFDSYFGEPGIVYRRIVDLPALTSALMWPRSRKNPRNDQFVSVARDILGERTTPQRGTGGKTSSGRRTPGSRPSGSVQTCRFPS
ncbi:LysR family transcriptional regulator [Fodinicola acaciae]|uniref:LysR family transcriptional regulator n=1 Tax=Fodinicola acaciae TaxID=2681555 RepID=UPI0013CF8A44|nr:LysR family transcriptional regulator [Fodinicola acaciae]